MDYFIFFEGDVKVFEGRGRWGEVTQNGFIVGQLKPYIKYTVEKYQMCLDDYFDEVFTP